MAIGAGAVLAERWKLASRLASGGMGDVYRATDLDGGDDVAVKVLREDVVQGPERFAGEIQTLRHLEHPHIVGVVDAGSHDGVPYFVMELLPGRSLADALAEGGLELEATRRIGAQIASALGHAHDHGIINRDVKPSNVLFAADGSVKLADFGIARFLDATRITSTGLAVGTASYIAPEQLNDPDAVGPATDVYALGLVLLEAASGQRAFPGTGSEVALARLVRDPVVPATLPESWQRLLAAMTARDPSARPDANQIADLLRAGLPSARLVGLPLRQRSVDEPTVAMPGAMVDATEPVEPQGARAEQAATERQVMSDRSAAAGLVATAGSPSDGSATTSRQPPAGRWRHWALGLAVALVAAVALVLAFAGDDTEDDPSDDTTTDAPSDDAPSDDAPADEGVDNDEPADDPDDGEPADDDADDTDDDTDDGQDPDETEDPGADPDAEVPEDPGDGAGGEPGDGDGGIDPGDVLDDAVNGLGGSAEG